MKTAKTVSNRPINGIRDNVGIGYVIVPSNVDKKQYIESCYRKGSLSIALENGGVIDNVLITKSALNEIEFPETFNTLGTILIWIKQPRKNQPIVIGCISKTNEFVNFSKNKSALRRATKDFVSEVLVDAEKGCIVINSNSSVRGGGDIYILSTNKDKTSKLNIIVSSDINVSSKNFTVTNSGKFLIVVKNINEDNKIAQISYEKGVGFTYIDEFGTKAYFAEDIQFIPASKFKVGQGAESAMLTNTFKSILEDVTDILSRLASTCAKITCPDSMGGTGIPNNAADFTTIASDLDQMKEKYDTFLSQINYTD